MKWIKRVCRFGLVALFLFTAFAKLAIIQTFVKNMGELLSSSGFDYQRWSWPATIVVIVAEIVTAVLLILPRTGANRRIVFGGAVSWFRVVRALLRLRVARRATRMWLFWWHHRQPARSENGAEKPGAACACPGCLVWLS